MPHSVPARPHVGADLDLDRLAGVSDEVAEICAEVAARLRAEIDGLADSMWEAIRQTIPEYRRLSAAEGDQPRQGIRLAAALFIDVMEHLRSFTDEERSLLATLGEERARQGINVDALGDAIHLASRTGYRRLRELLAEFPASVDTVTALGVLSECLFDYAQGIHQAMVSGYVALEASAADERAVARSEAVAALVDGSDADPDRIERGLREADVSVTLPGAVVVVTPRRHSADLEALRALLRSVPAAVTGPVRPTPRPHATALVPTSAAGSWQEVLDRLRSLAEDEDTVVIVEWTYRLQDVAPAYRMARLVLEVAAQGADAPGLVEVEEVLPYWIAASIPPAARDGLARRLLGDLLDDRSRESLCETLHAFWEYGGDPQRAGEFLGVSARTVRRRLEKVAELTGLVPQDPRGCSLLFVLVHLLSVVDRGDAGRP